MTPAGGIPGRDIARLQNATWAAVLDLVNQSRPSVSSTNLLAAGGDGIATKIAGPPLQKSKRAPRGRAAKKEAKDEAKRVWALASSAEAEALVARYVNQRE